LFYEHTRAWKPNNQSEEELKQASDETLTKINDIICEWIDAKEIKKIANRYKPHSEIRILKPSQLKGINEEEINSKNDVTLKLIKFVYDQLCKFNPKEIKGKAIYVILFEYFKKYIMGEINPASCADIVSILKESRRQELEEDTTMSQALETYIPLQANNYSYVDSDDNKNNDAYDCYQHIIDILIEKKEKEEKKDGQLNQLVLQGKSGSGKSLFCRHLEEMLWESYVNDLTKFVPVYISLSKCYNELNEKQIISQALQMKQINKGIIDVIRENISFVFILDGFDEIFDKYDNNKNNNNERYFYDRFNLNEWNAKIIVTCRSHVLNDENIKNVLIGSKNITTTSTSIMHLWPFSKEQMHGYIDKFVRMNKKNKMNDNLDWTVQQYEETLKNYPNLNKMMEEPFLLRMTLTVLPLLMKQGSIGTKISKSQVYEAFNEQWIDIHVKNISNKLSELRIQANPKKIKFAFQQYCQDLAFEMFVQRNQVATETDYKEYENDNTWGILDPTMEMEIKHMDEKSELKIGNTRTSIVKMQDIWRQYFNGDSIAKYVLRRVGDNKYQFLHKSCQEYYAAQKIIFDIISWKPNIVTVDNQQFQQQFEQRVPNLSINCKLLNEELGIIQFIAERIHDNNPIFVNLKSRLFRIIELSKDNENVNFTNASMNDIYFGEYAYLEGHSKRISGIQFSPDGTKIVSYSHDHTIRIWDTLSQKQLHVLKGHSDAIITVRFLHDSSKIMPAIKLLKGNVSGMVSAVFSPDDSKIAVYSKKTAQVLDTSSGEQLQLLEGHSDTIFSVQFSSDSSKIVSSSADKSIRIWDILSGKQLLLLEGHLDYVNKVQFISNGSKVISCSRDKTIRIWDILSGQQIQILEGHKGPVSGIQLSPDGSKILSYSGDCTLRLWDQFSGKQIHVFEGHSRWIEKARFSSDGSRIVSSSNDNTTRLWDVSSGKQIQLLEEESSGAEFFPKESKILSYSLNGTIRIWDVAVERKIYLIEGYLDAITGLQFSPDNSKIVSCSKDKTIRLWDVQSRRQIQVFEGHSDHVFEVLFSSDGSKIVSYSNDNTIRIWDVSSGKQLQLLEGHSDFVWKVQFSPDSSKLVSCSSDKTIRIWDISSGRQIQLLIGHSSTVTGVQFSPDGSKIVSRSWDKTVRLWDVLSGKQLQVFEGHSKDVMGVEFSPDGSKIVSCSWDKTVRVWDILSGNQHLLLEGHKEEVKDVQFSPDGSKIISCSGDKTIRLWNLLNGKQIYMFEGHADEVVKAQFSSDGSKIFSYSRDNTIRIWNASSGRQIQLLEGHTEYIDGIRLSSDGLKLASYSRDKTIRLWGCDNCKIMDVTETSLVKCVWRVGIQSSLLIKDSIWKDTRGLKDEQKLFVKQRGGLFPSFFSFLHV
ncbi:WD repeat-containing protein, partial [Reticulomyxa filosa]